jgi:hypothetical protein
MTYTARDFARELLVELQKGYDVVRLSRWAMATYLKHSHEIEPELKREIMAVVVMEEGPEFEMTEQELREFTERLMA